MICVKTEDEISIMREGAQILGRAHGEMSKLTKEGVNLLKINKVAEELIRDLNGIPSFLNYNGFPYSVCISLNDEVVHGMPRDYNLKNGDVVSIDCGVFFKGFHTDSAYTHIVGEANSDVVNLIDRTKQSLYLGIEHAVSGNRVGDLANSIQAYTESFGYGVVRELVGHGVGKKLHESPEVPNYGKKGKGVKLSDLMTIAIEPMINLGTKEIVQLNDGWTIKTKDGKPSAHFEHTVVVRKGKAEILTTFEYIEKKNG